MLYEELHAGDLGLPPDFSDVTLTVYARDLVNDRLYEDDLQRWGVLIIPGGGYQKVVPREGEPVALAFLRLGIQAFVLRYSVLPHRWPQAFLEAAAAMRYLRANGQRYHLGPDRLAVCGFSAGGHLAGCLANLWEDPLPGQRLGAEPRDIRPDAAILGYPAITAGPFANKNAFLRLTGAEDLPPELEKLSLEKSVTPRNPPTFLWTTNADQIVAPENTFLYAQALRACGVPFELHVFQDGPHGMALAERIRGVPEPVEARVGAWLGLCASWLNSL